MVYELKQVLVKDKDLLSLIVAILIYEPHRTVSRSTGRTRACKMFGRATNISRLIPSAEREEEQPQETIPASRSFTEKQPVAVGILRGIPRCINGTLVKRIGHSS